MLYSWTSTVMSNHMRWQGVCVCVCVNVCVISEHCLSVIISARWTEWTVDCRLVNQTSLKRLKLPTSNLTCIFPGTVRTWPLKNFSKGGPEWRDPLNFCALNAYSSKTVKATDFKFDKHVLRDSRTFPLKNFSKKGVARVTYPLWLKWQGVAGGPQDEAPKAPRMRRHIGVKWSGEWGGGIPLPIRLRGLGSTLSSPSGVRPKMNLVHFVCHKTLLVEGKTICLLITTLTQINK